MMRGDEPYWLEADCALGRIGWLIELAQAVYDGFGADDIDKWFCNGPLLLATQRAQADLTRRCLEDDPRCMSDAADDTMTALANAITVRLGDEPRVSWDTDALVALAAKAS